MNNYDFKKAFKLINAKKELISSASLGMEEDWYWTAETIFEDGEFCKDLKTTKTIAGIDGSARATPVLQIEYKDGTEEITDCYTITSDKFTAQEISEMKSYARQTGGMDSIV